MAAPPELDSFCEEGDSTFLDNLDSILERWGTEAALQATTVTTPIKPATK